MTEDTHHTWIEKRPPRPGAQGYRSGAFCVCGWEGPSRLLSPRAAWDGIRHEYKER